MKVQGVWFRDERLEGFRLLTLGFMRLGAWDVVCCVQCQRLKVYLPVCSKEYGNMFCATWGLLEDSIPVFPTKGQ